MVTPDSILHARILIVEDDRVSSNLIKAILKEAGFRNIRSMLNAKKVVDVYTSYKPDLMVLDLNLPDLDGFEVMRRLKALDPEDYLPILVISGDADEHVHLRALTAGAKDFLGKPYERAKVLLRARNLIETRLLHCEIKNKNKELELLVEARTKELRDSRIDVIRRLGYAAEYRDTETGKHIIRMSRYAAALAHKLGMKESDCELLLTTSPLHDVGKIAIPDRILLKAGPLTPEEWEVMKTHTEIGARLLSGGDSAFLRMAEAIALTHHERWDGKGYPRGLRGEEIPLVGRICAVCDVLDALTSERPYKKAWSFDEAAKEIKRLSGSHFDPAVVTAFFEIFPQLRSIAKEVEVQTMEADQIELRGSGEDAIDAVR
ncbi:MAG: response regulator [Candidatus Omnitrophica bacterium]|nr:response regulator [Candidatus Omnitrophota bacterium]